MKPIVMFFSMILCLIAVGTAMAETNEIEWFSEQGEVYNSLGEHFQYEVENDHAVLTRYSVEGNRMQPSVVTVPATFDGVPLTAIADGAFNSIERVYERYFDGEAIECLILPEGLITFQPGALTWAYGIQRIELPSTLAEIPNDGFTFERCSAEISFPNGNPFFEIQDGFLIDTRTDALLYCNPSAADQPLPRVKRIENRALEDYSPHQTVLEFPDSVEYIGSYNAYDCVDIETIIVPGSVTELADYAFQCNSATEIILNEGLQKIGYWAFADTEIESITIPASVTWIGYEPFGWWEPDELIILNPDAVWETEEEYLERTGEEMEEPSNDPDTASSEEDSDDTLIACLKDMGLVNITALSVQEGDLQVVLAEALDPENDFYVVIRVTPCAIGVYTDDEYTDIGSIRASAYETYLKSPDLDTEENIRRVLQSEIAVAVQHRQTLEALPELNGYVEQFPKNKKYDVYRGPGKEYGRSANGKASVSTNDSIWVYGIRGDWMLISYEISGNHVRYGWIHTAELPASIVASCPELVFPGDNDTDYLYATVTDATFITDLDSITNKSAGQVALGASVHCLATRSGWVLVELYADGHSWGFIDQKYLDVDHGYANYLSLIIPDETSNTWSSEEIQSAMKTVAYYYRAHAPGFSLLSLLYPVNENLPENANWPTDVPEGIEWMKLYGTVRSIAYRDFEIAGDDCVAEDLVFYVWREPGGDWIGGIGGYE